MSADERPVLVIGATGFLGRRVVAALRAKGHSLRCMARTPEKAHDLIVDGVTVVQGDMLDQAAVDRAAQGTSAVIVCIHTLSPQRAGRRDQGFMDLEAQGLRHVVAACKEVDLTRGLYVTSIGVAEHATSSWLRGRWQTEQVMFHNDLDVTVVRPGMIVGRGGDGFSVVVRGATKGSAMVTISATSIGRKPGVTLFIPGALVRVLAPLIGRIARVPRGAISGFIGDGPREDMIGDPAPVRAIFGRTDQPCRTAIEGQVL